MPVTESFRREHNIEPAPCSANKVDFEFRPLRTDEGESDALPVPIAAYRGDPLGDR
jgi:hypothetical protein